MHSFCTTAVRAMSLELSEECISGFGAEMELPVFQVRNMRTGTGLSLGDSRRCRTGTARQRRCRVDMYVT